MRIPYRFSTNAANNETFDNDQKKIIKDSWWIQILIFVRLILQFLFSTFNTHIWSNSSWLTCHFGSTVALNFMMIATEREITTITSYSQMSKAHPIVGRHVSKKIVDLKIIVDNWLQSGLSCYFRSERLYKITHRLQKISLFKMLERLLMKWILNTKLFSAFGCIV